MASAPPPQQLQKQDNPLGEGLERLPGSPAPPTNFRAAGGPSRPKLLPALYNLAHEGALPERFALIGVSRGEKSDDEFRDEARRAITEFSRRTPDDSVLEALLSRMRYLGFSFDDGAGYAKLAEALTACDEEAAQPLNRVYYLSTAPEYFGLIPDQLREAGLNYVKDRETRCVIEKPFGTDLRSARDLQARVSRSFREYQIFRIDHYLGKE